MQGRSQGDVAKEKISFNLARLKKGGENFEVVLKDPDAAIDFKNGMDINLRDVLETDKIFRDAKKGEVQSPDIIEKWLDTTDNFVAAEIILTKGEITLTAEHRKKILEAKVNKILSYIHMNAADPKTGLPHPVKRIELAMDQAKIHVDPNKTVEAQMESILHELRPILPMSFETMKIKVTIPARHAGSAYGTLKSKHKTKNDSWGNDGSVSFELEAPVGVKEDILNLINKLTNGEAVIEDL